MSTYILMKILESDPSRYDRGIRILTFGRLEKVYGNRGCPYDALYFRSPKKEIILPETIRKFKLNLIGKRLVNVENK